MPTPDDIARFWNWFDGATARLDAALREPDGRTTAIDELRFRVGKLGLAGDLLSTADGRHLIVGSPAGQPEQYLIAAYWLAAAPDDPRFQFTTSHPPQPIERLMASTIGGKHPVAISALRFAHRWRRTADLVDLTVQLPSGANGGNGPSGAAADRLAGSVLRSALGELEASAWLGAITTSHEPLPGGVDLPALMGALLPEIERRSTPRWEEYHYDKPGAPSLIVQLRQPLQPARHPLLDTCVELATELINDEPDEPGRMASQLLDDLGRDSL
ncbi:MAG: hypothetical protein QM679_12640, partial [Patulibacter sp.]